MKVHLWRYPVVRRSVLGVIAAAAVLSLSACGGGSGSSSTGTAAFALTDAPTCGDITSVVVTITGIDLVGPDGGQHMLTLAKPIQQDLLQLTNGATIDLGQISVPAGTYDQVRLLLAPNSGTSGNLADFITTSSGGTFPLTTPSSQQSGYKIDGKFTVNADGTVNVTIDFNACRSIVVSGTSGQYLLNPVLHETEDDAAGGISGSLPAADAGAVVMAEDAQGRILKTTVADSNGNFTLSPLEVDDSGTSYNVVAAPPQPAAASSSPSPDFAPDVVLHVPVTAGQTVTLPSSLPANASSTDQTYTGMITPASSDPDILVVAQETIPDGSASDVVTIAEANAVQPSSSSSGSTYPYSLTADVAAPYVATYDATGLTFAQVSPAPTPVIKAYGSDGSAGTATATTTSTGTVYDITLSGSGDDTFEMDH